MSVTRHSFLKRYHITKCHTFLNISAPNYVSLHSNPVSLSLILDMFDQLGITIGNFVLELLTSGGHEPPAVNVEISLVGVKAQHAEQLAKGQYFICPSELIGQMDEKT